MKKTYKISEKLIDLPKVYKLCRYCPENPFDFNAKESKRCPYFNKFIKKFNKYTRTEYNVDMLDHKVICSIDYRLKLQEGGICNIHVKFEKENSNCSVLLKAEGNSKEAATKSLDQLLL